MEYVEKVVSVLKKSKRLLFVTGAGISVASGIRAYRGIGGVWTENEKIDGVPIQDIMTGTMMRTRPELLWKCFSESEKICRGALPNKAHDVITEMERHFSYMLTFTQNIDGLHQVSGTQNVIEVHGSFKDLYCRNCDYRVVVKDYSGIDIPPLCPKCNDIIRPDIVLFGEMLPGEKLVNLGKELQIGFDAVFVVGTTCSFPYIEGPIMKARFYGSTIIEINPEKTYISQDVDIRMPGNAEEVLQKIWESYLNA